MKNRTSFPPAGATLLLLTGCALAGHLLAQAQHVRELRGTLVHTLGGAERFRHDLRALQARDMLRRRELEQTRADLDLQHQALLRVREDLAVANRALLETTWDLRVARQRRSLEAVGA